MTMALNQNYINNANFSLRQIAETWNMKWNLEIETQKLKPRAQTWNLKPETKNQCCFWIEPSR